MLKKYHYAIICSSILFFSTANAWSLFDKPKSTKVKKPEDSVPTLRDRLSVGHSKPVDHSKDASRRQELAERVRTHRKNEDILDYAYMLERGIGGPVDEDRAFRYYKSLAEQGYAPGQTQYAIKLHRRGGAENLNEAQKYLELAIDQGDRMAKFHLERYPEIKGHSEKK